MEEDLLPQPKDTENQDPISSIEAALREAAQTEQEKTLANLIIHLLNDSRKFLVKDSRTPSREGVAIKPGYERDWERDKDGRVEARLIVPVLYEGEGIVPSYDFQEWFLRNLGVLKEGQSINDFLTGSFPKYNVDESQKPTPVGPVRENIQIPNSNQTEEFITRIPTNINGVEARIRPIITRPMISVSISSQALQKIETDVAL